MKQLRSIKHILRLCAWSTVLGFCLGAQATTITQIGDNSTANGGESWLTTNDWDGAVNTPGNDYINATVNQHTRTPPGTVEPDPIFLGDSLTITNSARLKLKHSGVCTINDLRIWAGCSLINGGVGVGSSMAGNLALKGDGSVIFNMESNNRQQIIDMLVTADPTISTLVITSGANFSNSGFTFNNTGNTFAGTWDVQKGYLKGTGFGSGSFTVGANGILDFDSDFSGSSSDLSISAGGVVPLDQDITVNTLNVWGTQLNAGIYTGAELKAEAYGSAFTGATATNTITVLSGPVAVAGDTVYQTADMTPGIDWNDPAYWDNGLSPISTNDYINNNASNGVGSLVWSTRTPSSGSGTFGGNSLTLTNNAKMNIKSAGPWTINTLNIWAGSKINSGGPPVAEIAGGLNLKGTGSVIMDAQIPTRETTISSLLKADATITNIIVQIGQTAPTNTAQAIGGGFTVNGPLNEFDGVWVVEEGLLKGTGFGSGSFHITDMGYLDFDADYNNTNADLTIEANPTNAAQSGMILLDQNVAVGSATIWGASLAPGNYYGYQLKAHPTYGAAFDPNSDDVAILSVGASTVLPVSQIKNQSTGATLGWLEAASWNNGLAPTNTLDYVNSGYETRSPNISNPVFGGKSLTLSSGGYIKFRHTGTATITNLTIFSGGSLVAVTGNALDGDMALKGTGIFTCNTENDSRTLSVASLVSADDTITNIVLTCSDSTYTTNARTVTGTTFSNPANTFSGTWVVEKGYLKGAGMGSGSFLIQPDGHLDLDADYDNTNATLTVEINPTNSAAGGTILLDQNITVGVATLWGVELADGTYTAAELMANPTYGAAIHPSSTGLLTIQSPPVIVPEIDAVTFGMSGTDTVIGWNASSVALYTLQSKNNLMTDPVWSNVVGFVDIPGIDGVMSVTNATTDPIKFYRIIGN